MGIVQAHHDAQHGPSLPLLFSSFLRMGITAFGGPAMIAYIRKMAVGQKQWLDLDSFQDGVALCQTIPGATAMQMAAYVGLKTRGLRGAASCYVGFGLPAFLLMLGLSFTYSRTHELPAVISIFSGLQAVIVAVVANATRSFGKTSLKNWKSVVIGLIAAGLFWIGANPLLIIILAALLGVLLNGRQPLTPEGCSSSQYAAHNRPLAVSPLRFRCRSCSPLLLPKGALPARRAHVQDRSPCFWRRVRIGAPHVP